MKKKKYSRYNIQLAGRPRWNKKGQFFLIAALITIMILFTLTVKYNTIKQTVALEDFKEISEGYSTEQPKVINLAIAQNEDEARRLQEFTKSYVAFGQGREPSFGVLYAYRDSKGNIHVVNGLGGRAINIEFSDISGNDASVQLLGTGTLAEGNVGLNIGGQQFGTTVKTDIANYGDQLTATDLKNINKIEIIIPGYNPITVLLPSDFKTTQPGKPLGSTYSQSFTTLS